MLHSLYKVMLYNVDMALGNNIAAARDRMGFTQSELGAVVGVTSQAVSQWEIGTTVPDVDKLVPIARKLQVSVDWLLAGEEAALDPSGPWPIWKRLRADQRPRALRVLKALVEENDDRAA